MISIIVTLLIAVVGLLMYAFSANPKLVQVGYALFCIGAFWTVYQLIGQRINF